MRDSCNQETWVEFKNGIDDAEAFHLLSCGIKGKAPGNYKSKPSTKQSTSVDVEIVIDTNFDDFDEEEKGKFLEKIKRLLGVSNRIVIKRIERGSVKITIELDEADAKKLIASKNDEILKPFAVRSIQIVPSLPKKKTVRKGAVDLPASPPNIIVEIADDNTSKRRSVSSLLADTPGIEIAFKASNGAELIQQFHTSQLYTPDVILLDIHMPLMNGFETAKVVTSKYPHIPILALTRGDDDDASVIDMLEAGARGYIADTAPKEVFHEAIVSAKTKGHYYGVGLSSKLTIYLQGKQEVMPSAENPTFSETEQAILQTIGNGMEMHAIAAHFGLSRRTFQSYKEALLRKLHLSTDEELLHAAIKNWRTKK